MKRQSLLKLLIPTALLFATGAASQAATIIGSLPLNGGGLSQNGANLGVSTQITSTSLLNLSLGSGDYAFIPADTNFGASTLDYTSSATLSNFTFSVAAWGTFTASNDPNNQIVQKTSNFVDVFIIGVFTPGTDPGWTGKDPTTSSLRFSINQSGASISEAITLNSPAASSPVPEPGTITVLGALAGISLIFRRHLVR